VIKMVENPGMQFARYLQATGLPETLWDQLLEKIEQGDVGCAGRLQVRIPPVD
jgi:hypothetical protein